MANIAVPPPSLGHVAVSFGARAHVLGGLAIVPAALALAVPHDTLSLALWAAALTLIAFAVLVIGADWLRRRHLARRRAAFEEMAQFDTQPVFLTDLDGSIESRNLAAEGLLPATGGNSVLTLLGLYVAAPHEMLARLRTAAVACGCGELELPGAVAPSHLLVMRLGGDGLLWRLRDPVLAPPGDAPTEMPVALFEPDDSAPPTAARRNRSYFEELPVPVLQIARDGTVEQANRRARQMLGDADIEGQALSAMVEGLGRPIRDWLADAFEGRGLQRSEVVRMTPGTRDLYLQITLGQIGTGPDSRLIAVLNDATELKTLEAQFVQSQKMQAIGQLAGGVAHDFNNLLTAISGHCDLLLLRRDEFDPDFADLEQINQNANRAASLVGQLLAFSRKQNLRPEFLDLRHTLADLTHLLNRLVGEKVHLSFSHDPALRSIRADKRQLEQVIMNLVVNARDAMPGGGRIAIETQVETLDAPYCRDRVEVPPGIYVTVRVTDEGSGITSDKMPKIFEPFFTTKKTGEGTGLGLSTAYGIVKQTGGFIFADSTPGQGSCFSLYFPAHEIEPPKQLEPRTAAAPSPVQIGEGVVLLVEDEAPVRAFGSRALRLRGYTVIEAEDGEQALELLADGTLAVDIFVTDVIMPGLDGPSWVREALKTRPDTKVIFVSGYSEENMAEAQASIPNSIFLPKPFSLNQLTSTVQRQLQ